VRHRGGSVCPGGDGMRKSPAARRARGHGSGAFGYSGARLAFRAYTTQNPMAAERREGHEGCRRRLHGCVFAEQRLWKISRPGGDSAAYRRPSERAALVSRTKRQPTAQLLASGPPTRYAQALAVRTLRTAGAVGTRPTSDTLLEGGPWTLTRMRGSGESSRT